MVIQEHLATNVTISCDVLVCGGGFGGIAAALSAARQGKDVVLPEKQFMPGGLGTAGPVTIYLPLCDGMGRQVSFGIAEELLRLSISMGSESNHPVNWLDDSLTHKRTIKDQRFDAHYNPQLFAILVEKLFVDEGVRILYGTYAVAAVKNRDRIEAIIVENKSGRQAICARSFVDATGDCDIAHFVGAPTENFKQGNLLAAWYYALRYSGYRLNCLGCADIPESPKAGENQIPKLVSRRFCRSG